MFEFIKKMFIGLLTSIVNASSHTECVSLSNQKCTTRPTLNILLLLLDTMHLRVISIDVSEVVILLMTYLRKYVIQTKQKI